MGGNRSKGKGSKSKSNKPNKTRHRKEKVAFNDEVEIIHVEASYPGELELEAPDLSAKFISPKDNTDVDQVEPVPELREEIDPEKVIDAQEKFDVPEETVLSDLEVIVTPNDLPEEKRIMELCADNVHKVMETSELEMNHKEVLQQAYSGAQEVMKDLNETKDKENYSQAKMERAKNLESCINAHKKALERTKDGKRHAALFKPFTPAKVALEDREKAGMENFPFVLSKTVQEHLLFADKIMKGKLSNFESKFDKAGMSKVKSEDKNVSKVENISRKPSKPKKYSQNSALALEHVKKLRYEEMISDEGSLIGGVSTNMPSEEDWDKFTHDSFLSFTRVDSIYSLSSISSHFAPMRKGSSTLFSKVYDNFKTFCQGLFGVEMSLSNPFSSCMLCCA